VVSVSVNLIASRWTLEVATPLDRADAAVAQFLATESVPVERMTKKGMREFDCRAAVVSLTVGPDERGARLDLVLRHTVPAVRPDDVLTGLASVAGVEVGESPLLTRLEQGPLDEATGEIGDPLLGSA